MDLNAQDWAVGAIVAAAALYALWYWLPAGLRRHLGAVRPALAHKPGCGSCSSCSGCDSGKDGKGSPVFSNAPAEEDSNPAGVPAPQGAERRTVWMARQR